MSRSRPNPSRTGSRAESKDTRSDRDAGDTLIEVLFALVVLALTSVALIIAFSTSISGSAEHRRLATADVLLGTVSQDAIAGVDSQLGLFACTDSMGHAITTATFQSDVPSSSLVPAADQSQFSATISQVQWWNGTTFTSTCNIGAPEEITVTLTNLSTGAHYYNTFVVDFPLTSTNSTSGAAPATTLVFTTQPNDASGEAGAPFVTQPVVEVENASGQPVSTDYSPVILSLESTVTGAVLSGCSGNENPGGIVTFSGCAINDAGSGYMLVATDGGLTATSNAFTVGSAGAFLVFTHEPVAGASGSTFATEPQVTVEIWNGSANVTDTSWTGTITLTPAGGDMLGTCSGSSTNGVWTAPSACSFEGAYYYNPSNGAKDAAPYTMTATGSSTNSPAVPVVPATSTTFSVTGPGPATQLAFTTQPTGATGTGASHTFASFAVSLEDAFGNVAYTSANAVTLGISSGTLSGCSSSMSNGVDTVTGCYGSVTGNGLTLTASSSGLTSATSSPFNITGAATKLVFTVQPVAGVSGAAFTTMPKIAVEDASGNVVTASSAAITLTPSGGILQYCTSLTAISGIVNVTSCAFAGVVGTPYTLTAASTGLTSATSSSFTPTGPGVATQVVFTTEPVAGVAGSPFTTAPVVKIEDTGGNVVTTSFVTVSFAATGGTLSCPSLNVVTVNGVGDLLGCTFGGLVGTPYQLTAASANLTTGVSSNFSPTAPGPASLIAYTVEPPATGTAGSALASFSAAIQDAYGNTVTSGADSTDTVGLAIATAPTNGIINSGTTSVAAVAGVASFGNIVLDTAGGYTFTAADQTNAAVTSATSTPATTVNPAAPFKVVFTTQPSGGTGGVAWATQPKVSVEDTYGNLETGNTSSVTIAITGGTGAAGATLGCTNTTVSAVAGVATFAGCEINKAANNYSLTATDGVLASGTSNTFNITVGAASQLVFTTQPVGGVAEGTNFATQPKVTVEDAGGNVVTGDTGNVTLALNSYAAGNGGTTEGTLGCTNTTVAAVAGVATFAGCQITGTAAAGTYTLAATRAGLTTGTSSNVTINAGAASKLVFTTQPVGGVAEGTNFATQPKVTVEDANGNVVTGDTGNVTLALNSYAAGNGGTTEGTLGCTNTTVAAVAGVATFAGCQITGTAAAGTYTLAATRAGLTTGTSSNVTINAGAASKLVFTTQPVGGVAEGTNFATQPKVTVEDANGNVVTGDTGNVTLALNSYAAGNGGTTEGTLGCTNTTVAAVAGVATFAGCQITGTAAAGTYTLAATRAGLTTGTSSNVTINAGAASKLVFTTQPVGGVAEGTNFATQPKVTVEDANGNVVTGDTGNVTLALNSYAAGNGGTTEGTLGCTNTTVAAVAGVATFAGCQITGTAAAGTYTLAATRAGLTTGTSSNVTITAGAASKVVFTTQPSGGTGGLAWATQPKVSVEDASGNVVTGDTSSVTIAITGGTGAAGATLGCTNTTVSAVAGVATFAGCEINKAANNYSLTATDGVLASGTSNTFNITVGAASQLVFTTQPVGGVAEGTNFATQPKVTVEDAGGNVVTGDTGNVTLALNSYAAGNGGTTEGTLGCTNTTVAAVAGVATFAGCQITGTAAAGTYTLAATRAGLTTGTSSNVTITAGAASKLVFTTQPVGGVAEGTNFATQPKVSVEDANGNVVTGDTGNVTLALNSYAAGNGGTTEGTLGCTNTTVAAVAGVATFAGCQITGTAAAGTYTLAATRAGLTTGTSSNVTINAGAASKLVFTTQPVGGVAEGTNFATQPKVTVEDANGNVVTGDTGNVTLALNSYAAGNGGTTEGTLGCTNTTVAAVAGVATFAGCQITGTAAAGTYTLAATRAGLTTGTSSNVTINAGAASKLVFTTQPVGGVAEGTNFATQPKVTVEDANGNVVTGDTGNVTLALNSYAAGNGGTTEGTLGCTNTTVAAVAGVATFAGCQITGTAAAGTYTLAATRAGLTTGTSSNVTINAGAASKLGYAVQPPKSGTTGTALSAFEVAIEDANGNVVTSGTGSTDSVTLSVATGPGTISSASATYTNVAAVAGIATFNSVYFNTAGAYTLTATDSTHAYTSTTSNSFTVFGFSVLATAGNSTSDSTTITSPSFTAPSGMPVLILVSFSSSSATPTCQTPTSSGTGAFPTVTTVLNAGTNWYSSGNRYSMCAFSAVGQGAAATVTETVSSSTGNTYAAIQVVGIVGDNAATFTAATANATASANAAPIFKTTAPTAGTSEVLFGDTTNNSATAPYTWSSVVPAGYALESTFATVPGVSGSQFSPSVYFGGPVSTSTTGSLSGSGLWGTIGIDVVP